jgi:NitT/TauT family transport system substrate-binding protein
MAGRRVTRLWALLLVGLVGALLATACGSMATGSQGPTKVRLGYNKTWTTPFLLIAKQQDAYTKAGVEVEWFEFQTPPQALEALAARSIDAAIAPVPNLVTAVEKGLDVKAVLHLAGWSDPTSTYFVRADSGIESVRDLKGKKIGVNNYGGNFDLYLRHMLDENGVDSRRDAQILEIPIAAIYQALDTSQIDVGVVPALFVPRAEQSFPGKFKPLFTYKDIPGIAQRPQFNQLVLVMPSSFTKDQRAAAKAFIKANVDTQHWAVANRAEGGRVWAEAAGVPGLAQMPDPFGPDSSGLLDLPALELDAALVHKYGYVKTAPPLTKLYDLSLVEEVNAGK